MRFDELPEVVRGRVIALAAAALGSAAPAQVPSGLAAVARFAPAKRAKRGAVPLTAALESDAAFRALVSQAARVASEDERTDDVGAVSLAFLLRHELPEDALRRLTATAGLTAAQQHISALEREVGRLTSALERATTGRSGHSVDPAAGEEADRLRRRLREQGTKVRAAERQVGQLAVEHQQQLTDLSEQLVAAEIALRSAEARADQAIEETDTLSRTLAAQRESSSREVGARDRRIELLLSTVIAAAVGLRREWNLATGGDLPADVVARQLDPIPATARQVADPSTLAELLAVPGAHLIVDGYNVTKTGYGELPLTEQRDRLIRSLSVLSARTSAEVTVVFDGAAVSVVSPQGRKIRVLFSPAGVIADDVIRRLVAAEPAGRLLLVVTSDRAVVGDVAHAGARTAGSDVLLRLVGR
ncbi:MAG: NYN domain-containing protein [Actinomycetota bacterium]|nr:NYN domain-containing protein [Actinomycetota bacterium]